MKRKFEGVFIRHPDESLAIFGLELVPQEVPKSDDWREVMEAWLEARIAQLRALAAEDEFKPDPDDPEWTEARWRKIAAECLADAEARERFNLPALEAWARLGFDIIPMWGRK